MQVAQKLYEGMEIDGTPVGLITYMRTDSVRISDDAHAAAKDFILNNYGKEYYPDKTNIYVKGNKMFKMLTKQSDLLIPKELRKV